MHLTEEQIIKIVRLLCKCFQYQSLINLVSNKEFYKDLPKENETSQLAYAKAIVEKCIEGHSLRKLLNDVKRERPRRAEEIDSVLAEIGGF